MTLDALLALVCPEVPLSVGMEVSSIQLGSRLVTPGAVFIAIAGTASHGMHHIDEAIRRGAIAVLYDDWAGPIPAGIPSRHVPNLRGRLPEIGAAWHRLSFGNVPVFGVTGTNGKTTVVALIAQLSGLLGVPMGRIGTLGVSFGRDVLSNTDRTTADALTLAGQCADLLSRGAQGLAMEVSSHALDQGRVEGIPFSVGIFTNLTRDHLDYHGTLENYGAAKARLFQDFGLTSSVLWIDDPFVRSLAATARGTVWTVGQLPESRVRLTRCLPHEAGTHIEMTVDGQAYVMQSPLYGLFNAQNVLLAMTALVAMEMAQWSVLVERVAQLEPAPGRMEQFRADGRALVVVDYAHTPDALQQVLSTLCAHTQGRLWVVFGCGGDRDQGKRPVMGEIASRFADVVILTDDNPRSEAPNRITDEIVAGMIKPPHRIIHSRTEAIRTAIEAADPLDCIVVAGKGHERVQVIGDRAIPYSDRATVAAYFGLLGGVA